MAHISPEEVRVIATLARLSLGAEESERMARELEGILGYIEQVQGMDTSGVEPLTHAVSFDCPLRPDEVGVSLPVEEALANAPRREDRFFQVPRIVPGTGEGSGGERG